MFTWSWWVHRLVSQGNQWGRRYQGLHKDYKISRGHFLPPLLERKKNKIKPVSLQVFFLLIKLNSHQCLIHICCRPIQPHKGKSMNIFRLHSWKSRGRWWGWMGVRIDSLRLHCLANFTWKRSYNMHTKSSCRKLRETGLWTRPPIELMTVI